jgi:D-glycero-D-manno-heptose 1,7-bisphosphate phosphatase
VQAAVFLDRDNTLIHNDGDLGDPEQVRLVDGVPAGLKALRQAGFHLVVVTNQAGVARGRFSEEDVDAVNQRIALLADRHARSVGLIDRFYYCPYHPEAQVPEYKRDHPWRKPNPGMILQAARDMQLDLGESWMIGDQERDVLAGRAAGCRTILVTRDAQLAQRLSPTEVAGSFSDAVSIILRHHARARRAGGNGKTQPPSSHSQRDSATESSNAFSAAGAPSVAAQPAPREILPQRSKTDSDNAALRRALSELAEEIRTDRLRRGEFTLIKMLAGLCQLLVVLLALLGLLQLNNLEILMKWMIGAVLAQLLTITLLILDLKG